MALSSIRSDSRVMKSVRAAAGGEVLIGGFARERDDTRFEAGLVAVRRVHVAELVVRGHGAAARTDQNERAVVALLPRRQPLEVAQRLRAVVVLPVIDVSGRLQR